MADRPRKEQPAPAQPKPNVPKPGTLPKLPQTIFNLEERGVDLGIRSRPVVPRPTKKRG
jgi:hypothetical protein